MKILLMGEFSGLHKNLKEGLVELGHEVDIASSGDGWKNVHGDIDLGSSHSGLLGKADKMLNIIKSVPKFKNYDVVQFVAPVLFPRFLGINRIIVNYIFKHNRKVFLVGAGCNDSATADFLEKKFRYPELFFEIKQLYPLWSQTKLGRNYNRWFLKKINGFIPIMYEYAQGYRDIQYEKLCPTIPIPLNVDKIKYEDNIVKNKLVFFHGITREGVKGTPLIREAMKRLKSDYPDQVECILDGGMPLDEYLELLKKTNVVIDQVYSVSSGVNAVYNLAMGKVVVGGGEPEFLEEFNLKDSPLVCIQSSVDDIYNQLEVILKNKHAIVDIGRESRKFAEELHDYKKVAQKYIKVWNEF